MRNLLVETQTGEPTQFFHELAFAGDAIQVPDQQDAQQKPGDQSRHGRTEVLEGSAVEDLVILEFPRYEDAKAWYHGSAYQAASKHRHQGGD